MNDSHIYLSVRLVDLVLHEMFHGGFGCDQWKFLVYKFKHIFEVELLHMADGVKELGEVSTVDRILVCEVSLIPL